MSYLIGACVGLVYGAVIAAVKYYFVWRPYVLARADNLAVRSLISNAVNVLALLAVLLLRGYWPFSFAFTILGAAVGLSTGGKLLANRYERRLKLQPQPPAAETGAPRDLP